MLVKLICAAVFCIGSIAPIDHQILGKKELREYFPPQNARFSFVISHASGSEF